jgi:hypothetical protein
VPRLRSAKVVLPPTTHIELTVSQPQAPPQSRTQVYLLQSGVGNGVGTRVVGEAAGGSVVIEVGGSGVVVVACAVSPPPQPQHMLFIVKCTVSNCELHRSGFVL